MHPLRIAIALLLMWVSARPVPAQDAVPPPKLKFAPPVLDNPITLSITKENTHPKFTREGADYVIVFKEAVNRDVGLNCNKARHVVVIGGEINQTLPVAGEMDKNRRGMYIQHWTGTFHLEGVWMHGPNLAEGLNIHGGTPGTVLQIQNVRIDEVKGNELEQADYRAPNTHHPDVVQNWAGPTYFYIDRLTGITHYQGFMMQPRQFGETDTILAEFNHVNIRHTGRQGYQIFRTKTGTRKMVLNEVYLQANAAQAYPHDHPDWARLKQGDPPGGDFVRAGTPENGGGVGVAGMGYISPGYVVQE